MNSNLKKSLLIVFVILLIDQAFKIWVKTNMYIGESSFRDWGWSFEWFQVYFIENKGMAFGWALPGESGKIFLSIFRIIASIIITIYIIRVSKKKIHPGFLFSMSLILAGAVGNIIDSAFYGLIFSESGYAPNTVAEIFPAEGGYAGFLHGKVVDMLYFPLIEGTFPDWMPFWGGEDFIFFRPIFNIADSAITIGVFIILIFQKRFFAHEKKAEKEKIEQTEVN